MGQAGPSNFDVGGFSGGQGRKASVLSLFEVFWRCAQRADEDDGVGGNATDEPILFLTPSQFSAALVLLARFQYNSKTETVAEALSNLLQNDIIPVSLDLRRGETPWRQTLRQPDLSRALTAYRSDLYRLFKRHAVNRYAVGAAALSLEYSQREAYLMTWGGFVTLCKSHRLVVDAGGAGNGVTNDRLRVLFCQVQQTGLLAVERRQTGSPGSAGYHDHHHAMAGTIESDICFDEFVEAIAAIGLMCSCDPFETAAKRVARFIEDDILDVHVVRGHRASIML
eukprot:g4617.t1